MVPMETFCCVDSDDLGELLHARLAAHADAVEQLDARRVRERLEALC